MDALTLQSTKATNDATVSTGAEELAKDQASTDLTNAQTRFEQDKTATITELNNQIKELQAQISDLETYVKNAESISNSVAGNPTATPSPTVSGGIDNYITQRDAALQIVKDKVTAIGIAKIGAGYTISSLKKIEDVKSEYNKLYELVKNSSEYQTMIADYNAALSQYYIVENNFNNASSDLSQYSSRKELLESKKEQLNQLQSKLVEVQAITASSDGDVQDAQNRLNQANRNILEITTANSQASVAWQNRIADANDALKTAQAVYDLLKEEQTSLAADINAELDLSKTNKDIQKKKEEIEKLKEKSMGSAVKAPVAGTITTVKYVAGETTQPEDVMAVIQPEGKGFTLSISVTNEQAKKVQIGDMAELQNSWYYDDARVMLSAIKPDPDNPGTNKLLVFDVSGSTIQADQSLSISVGQRSQEYELVVPNSAIREDNDGKFILTVESKSSPLGNRYIATRVGVEVLASDDNNSAISAPLYGWEYVITTSTKPVEAGKQVRLADNS